MYKNIVRYMTVGEPVIIGARPKEEKPEEEPESEKTEEESEAQSEAEPESESESEAASGIPQEILDKVFAEIEEIERKEKLTSETLLEAQKNMEQAEEVNRQAQKEAQEIKSQAESEAEKIKSQAQEIKIQAEEIKSQAEEIKTQAQTTLDAAHKEADKIVEDTRLEAEKLLEKVHKEGYDDGYKEGKEQGIKDGKEKIEEELADTIRKANDKAQKTIEDAKMQTSEYFIRAEDDIAQIVMLAIEKILPQHFIESPQVILPVVREAVEHVRDQREVKIHVEPDSYDLVLMARGEFQAMLSDGTAIIEVISDEALKPGDCVIETPNGGVDARLSTQLDLMKRSIQSVMNRQ